MLLGAETAPRLVKVGRVRWGTEARIRELRAKGAEQVEYDYVSPDLRLVLNEFQKLSKRDARFRSPDLLRALLSSSTPPFPALSLVYPFSPANPRTPVAIAGFQSGRADPDSGILSRKLVPLALYQVYPATALTPGVSLSGLAAS